MRVEVHNSYLLWLLWIPNSQRLSKKQSPLKTVGPLALDSIYRETPMEALVGRHFGIGVGIEGGTLELHELACSADHAVHLSIWRLLRSSFLGGAVFTS